MTEVPVIEIRQQELEALIMERLQTGTFQDVEDVLYQALTQAPLPANLRPPSPTTADIFAAFRRSPFKDVDIEPEPFTATISDISSTANDSLALEVPRKWA